ncbi:AAA family ATPase [Haloferax massiliensis]|uniref:ATPase AAA-type core domain-containing protein n=1 Tax=Haloferax massiliensis TaxID=1476858 RepID=A0A0D6JMA3_9EURY|nr:AAA family ATPase [Haloferax massiliensis]CQR49021.1 hypothetical protein BN996_00476 [Haloferax massiliensis]
MRLSRIRIKNYRSIFDEGDEEYALMELSPSGNYIVGPNNVGKSNIIRALQLALRPEGRRDYSPELDMPKQKKWAYPTITLDFEMERKRGPYKTLLRYVDEYERSVPDAKSETFADQDRVRFYVKHTTEKDSRQELFLANGAGSRKGDEELLEKALNQFHEVVRLVDIESGEDLDSLLQRGFNELFAQVLSERFRDEIETAKTHRENYRTYLEEDILDSVDEYITKQLSNHIPGIQSVNLSPKLGTVESTLADVDIQMDDSVETPLHLKGTGVRSAVIQMIMSFIADASRRAVVFAIEEPEAFLHPERHASLANELESFTSQSDISLIATTHSPFLLTNDSEAGVFTVSKNSVGQTIVESGSSRQDSIRRAKRLLTGSRSVPTALDIIDSISDTCDGILIVEGTTDEKYLKSAARCYPDGDLLEGIHIVSAEGAKDVVKDTVVLNRIFDGEKTVHALLDDDGPGDKAHTVLTSRLQFDNNREISKYSRWRPKDGEDVEAEDLFPDDFIEAFAEKQGDDVIEGFGTRNDGTRHYELVWTAKDDFTKWVDKNADIDDFELWYDLIYDVRDELGLPDIR